MKNPLALTALALSLTPLTLAGTAGDDWPHWRGPSFNGSAEATGLPELFDKDTNVAWSVDLPGPGASTPVVAGGRLFLTSIEPESGALLALCLDAESGEVLWEHDAGSGYRPGDQGSMTVLHNRSNYASPSAVVDGERVVFFFGNGDLVAYDFEGEQQWARNLQADYGDFAFQWTFSASPTIYEGRLILPILQRDEPVRGLGKEKPESFVLGLDPKTGDTRYKITRASDARKESLESYVTAIPFQGLGGRKEVLIVGGDVITGHDPVSGEELWRWGTWNQGHREIWWRVVPSAVVGGEVVLACAPKGAPVYAVRLGGEGKLGEDALAWKSEGRRNPITSDVPTPLYFDSKFFVLSDVQDALSRVDPSTGTVEWTVRLPREHKWRASPTGADGKIYLMDHGGLVLVIDPNDGSIKHRAEMGQEGDDGIRSTIAVANGHLYIRTNSTLYCIGEE